MNIPQSIEWLQSQGQVEHTVDSLKRVVNVQTGLISQLNEELLQLRLQHQQSHDTLCTFMKKEGFNYPDNAYKGKD
jgi:hypothetical protein